MAAADITGIVPIPKSVEVIQVQPIAVSLMICGGLFGIGILQFWFLFRQLAATSSDRHEYWKDLAILTLLLVTDIVDSIGKGIFFFVWLSDVITKGYAAIEQSNPWIISPCIMGGWTALCVHIIYARRLWRIIPNKCTFAKLFILLTLLLSLFQFIASILTGLIVIKPIDQWSPKVQIRGTIWLGGAGLTDLLLCWFMIYYLRRHRGESLMVGECCRRRNGLITRFVYLTFETGMVPAILQLLELGLFLGMPKTRLHFSIAFVIPKVYLNGVLVLLRTAVISRQQNQETRSYGGGNPSEPQNQIDPVPKEYIKCQRIKQTQGIIVSSDVHTVQETIPYQEPVRLAVRSQSSNESLEKNVNAMSQEKNGN